jgi:photosystem II stability/assembly factor-like uncharacterized protein
MRSIYLLMVYFLFPSFLTYPQKGWFLQNPTIPPSELNKVVMLNDSTALVAGWKVLLYTTNFGKSWGLQPHSLGTVRGLHALNLNEFWITLINGIAKTTDGGLTFSRQYNSPTKDIYASFFLDSLHGWAVGGSGWGINAEGLSVRTTNGGVTWITSNAFPPPPLFGTVKFFNKNYGFAGGSGGYIGKTVDGGVNWSSSNGWGGSYESIVSIDFRDSSTVFALTYNGKILKTTDAGGTWNIIHNFADYPFSGIQFLNSLDGTIFCNDGKFLFTSDGGESWIERNTPDVYRLNGFYMASSNHLITAGNDGIIFTTSDRGVSWKSIQKDVLPGLNSFWFVDEMKGWAVGDSGKILGSTDGGTSWTESSNIVSSDLNSIEFIDQDHGWIGGNNGTVLYTQNGGNAWSVSNVGQPLTIKKVKFINPTTGWAISDSVHIYKTLDGGVTWTFLTSDLPQVKLLTDVVFLSENKGLLTGSYFSVLGSIYIFLQTTDGGASWSFGDQFNNHSPLALSFVDSLNGCMVVDFTQIHKTTNGGTTWTAGTVYAQNSLNSIHMVDQQTGWAAGSQGTILKTTDGGAIWRKQLVPFAGELSSIMFVNTNTGWAIGPNNTFMKTSDGGITSLNGKDEIVKVPETFDVMQNYPNPFNPSTTIRYSLKESAIVKIRIFNMAGELLRNNEEGFKQTGTHQFTFDANGFPSGVYIAVVEAGNMRKSIKMLLLK